MAEYFDIAHIFVVGGPTMLVLVAAFLVAAVIIVERWIYYRAVSESADPYLLTLSDRISRGEVESASSAFSSLDTPVPSIIHSCLASSVVNGHFFEDEFEEAKSRAIAGWVPGLERYLGLLATLGNVSPFIGLLGTVLGIIRAFVSLSDQAAASATGMAGLNAGIAEALVTTAAGLFVAIPSTIAYNIYRNRTDRILLSVEIALSRLKSMLKFELSLLKGKGKGEMTN